MEIPKFYATTDSVGPVWRAEYGGFTFQADEDLLGLMVIGEDGEHAAYDISSGEMDYIGGDEDFDWPDELVDPILAAIRTLRDAKNAVNN